MSERLSDVDDRPRITPTELGAAMPIEVICPFKPEVHGPHEWFSPEHTEAIPPAVICPGRTEPAAIKVDRGDWMQTYTGRAFYPMVPAVEDIDPADIAHALSLLCRYGGHVRQLYVVAEHCVLMSYAVAPENALWALLHDATEAYVGDMVRPLKSAMPAYRAAEDRLMRVICDRFGIGYDCPAEVKAADNRILRDERDALMAAPPLPWTSIEDTPALGVQIGCWPPVEAEWRYLARLAELT